MGKATLRVGFSFFPNASAALTGIALLEIAVQRVPSLG